MWHRHISVFCLTMGKQLGHAKKNCQVKFRQKTIKQLSAIGRGSCVTTSSEHVSVVAGSCDTKVDNKAWGKESVRPNGREKAAPV